MLIDGDNAQSALIEAILSETSRYGLLTMRRIYGDWTEPTMKGWKETLHHHAVQPIQQFRYTVGKNVTDSALIIDAMDILYEGVVDGFCLVTSDSDYTRLATRIREKGLFVMGIGRKDTPRAFVNACEVFIYTENLAGKTENSGASALAPRRRDAAAPLSEPPATLRTAVEMAAQEDGWASLGSVGNMIQRQDPGFDPRTFGHRTLSRLVRAYPDVFEVRETKRKGGPSSIYVKLSD